MSLHILKRFVVFKRFNGFLKFEFSNGQNIFQIIEVE